MIRSRFGEREVVPAVGGRHGFRLGLIGGHKLLGGELPDGFQKAILERGFRRLGLNEALVHE